MKKEPSSGFGNRVSAPAGASGKIYSKPQIIEWGSIVDLTQAGLNDTGDVTGFFGTSPTFSVRPPGPPRPGPVP